jgi:protein TonB
LSGELALACPTRTPPAYPVMSRRMGETGKVVLRVELDAEGRVDTAQVISSSGFKRLDEAALSAVRSWRCNPPLRDGQPVRAVALQPFQFNLE